MEKKLTIDMDTKKAEAPRIYSVSEAFSIQPRIWRIGNSVRYLGNPITRIAHGSIYDTGDPYDAYIGYDAEGNKVFEIRVMCATVEYF
jgi:hypothetical protein